MKNFPKSLTKEQQIQNQIEELKMAKDVVDTDLDMAEAAIRFAGKVVASRMYEEKVEVEAFAPIQALLFMAFSKSFSEEFARIRAIDEGELSEAIKKGDHKAIVELMGKVQNIGFATTSEAALEVVRSAAPDIAKILVPETT